MTETTHLAGIDVSAKTFNACVDRRGGPSQSLDRRELPNTTAGHLQLIRYLTKGGCQSRACLEATGVYSVDLALALHGAEDIEVMVVNPRAARDFAKAQLKRSKTDKIDAAVLLEFCRRMPFRLWHPPEPEVFELRAIAHRIAALAKTRNQELSRSHATSCCHLSPEVIQSDIGVNIRHLERRIQRLKELAVDCIWGHVKLRKAFAHMTSIKGIGTTSAIRILAEISVLPEGLSARQWVAHAGLDPCFCDSGTSVNRPGQISRTGNRLLRTALYFPALVAIRHEPNVRAFYDKLIDNGKKPKQAIVAVMRKLLHAIHGMIRSGTDFDGDRFYAPPPEDAP